jgi:serine/threonine protein kinase
MVLRRSVAIKVPHRRTLEENPSLKKMFLKEATFLASLDHPGVLPLYDYFDSSLGPVLVTRYVRSVLQNAPPEEIRQPRRTVSIASQLASSLDYCVSQGLAHRDIKPDNILLDENGFAYLTDFGLAARLDEDAKWKRVVGTPSYVSPELLFEQKLGSSFYKRERSDQFSFGALLYSVLTGHLPFEGPPPKPCPTGWEFCTALRLYHNERLIPCSERNPLIPAAMDNVVSRMLSIDPSSRFATNRDAAEQVAAALEGRAAQSVNAFISYSHGDRPHVAQIIEGVKSAGVSVWWDRDIVHGADWDDQIEDAMDGADVMLLFLSTEATDSAESKREWKYWLDHIQKPLIPVMLHDCRVPYRLSPLQRLEGRSKEIDELVNEICSAISRATRRQQEQRAQPPSSIAIAPLGKDYFKGISLHSLSPGALDALADLQTGVPSEYQLSPAALQKYIQPVIS